MSPEDGGDRALHDLYRRAWVNVLPSVYVDCRGAIDREPEHMGFTLLEAMSCATPAICSRVGGMSEFVRDGSTGFVFDDRDHLAGMLRRLAGDPGLVDAMGREARLSMVREFDLKVAGRNLFDLYSSLANREDEPTMIPSNDLRSSWAGDRAASRPAGRVR